VIDESFVLIFVSFQFIQPLGRPIAPKTLPTASSFRARSPARRLLFSV
jgi:hypothetical protein